MLIRRFAPFISKGLALSILFAWAGPDQANAGSEEFGRCLTRQGAIFYGASWCPQCRAQRRLLGSAMRYVRYVECSVGGDHERETAACRKADIDGYPTWVFADGSRVSGRLSLASLAARSGCEPPGAVTRDEVDRTDDNGVRRRKVGGALVIDIPE